MHLPKALLPSTEKEILEEISKELDIPIHDVKKTYNIWLDFLDDTDKNTDQAMVFFPGLGKMFSSLVRLKDAPKEYAEMKKARIEKDLDPKYRNFHRNVPINIIYGVGRYNYKIEKSGRYNKRSFFTKDEIIRRQNINFFKEDKEFNDRKDIFEEYFNNIKPQIPYGDYKDVYDYKVETQRQEQIKRCKMVRREKIYMQWMFKELEE